MPASTSAQCGDLPVPFERVPAPAPLWTASPSADGCRYRDAMLLRRAVAPLAILAALALAGCSAPEPEAEATVAPTEEPLFASEEEALAAAEEVYSAYQAAVDRTLNNGGSSTDDLTAYATIPVVELQKEGFTTFSESGWRSEGSTKLDTWTLQSFDDANSTVTFYVCKDVSDVRVFDASGQSVVSADRPSRAAVQVRAVTTRGDLVIAEESVWARGLPGC